MAFRDDHEAALARAAALEAELERERADDATREARMERVESELAEARARLAGAERALAEVRPEEPSAPAVAEKPPPSGALAWMAFLCLVTFFLIVGAAATRKGPEPPDPSPRRYATPKPRPPSPPALPTATPDRVSSLLAEARERASRTLPGGYLTELHVEAISRDGELSSHGEVTFDFYDGERCVVFEPVAAAWLDRDVARRFCRDTDFRRLEPRCTTTTIWQMALADGADPDELATIDFDGKWSFEMDDGFRRTYADECNEP